MMTAMAFALSSFSQTSSTLSGDVRDESNNKPLWGANVYIESLSRGTVVKENGTYELEIPNGKYTVIFSFVGYENKIIDITLEGSQDLSISLKPLTANIQEVIVSDKRAEDKITETETGLVSFTKEELQDLPYLMGEIDPIRIIQLMPGVHTAGEGNTGFYVRGGAVDQNLILLDDAIVYNPSHLFGFFSIFNGNILQSMDLYKGGIPANYGGRLSSITRVNTRQGNTQEFKGEAGIGLLSTNIVVEGPIKKNKGSFVIAGRRTYIDLFIDPVRELFSVEEKLNYYFYDLNINADYNITKKDHLRLRSYTGKDKFSFGTGSSFSNRIEWGNRTASLSWIHSHRENVISEFSLTDVSYNMEFGAGINNYEFEIYSDIRDHSATYQLDIRKNKHSIKFGVNYTYHRVSPNNVDAQSDSVELDFNKNVVLYADEASIFLNDKITVNDKLEISAGIRFTTFSHLGNFTRYLTDENFQLLDTVQYGRNYRITTYANPEPRLAVRYSLNQESSLKFSVDRGYQYMHMAPLSSASLPMDVWVTSSKVVKPQYANQFSVGYFRNFENNTYETSAVIYYKDMYNQLEYRDGVIIGYSKGYNYDDNFVFGKGKSYGAEFLVKKNSGKLTGMVAYTLARTTRTFDELNAGNSFPAKYDRLHDLSILANYEHNSKWTFSGVFVYGTGNALNLPVARYVVQGNVVNEYGKRNSFRMPAYHRLDLSATWVRRKTKSFESAWIFSVYNAYNRRNPYYIYFETKGDLKEYKLETSLKQVSLFPVLPSVTYRVKF
jgi:hypothetical protein